MHTSQPTTFCHILPCTLLSQQPSAIFFHAHISANNLLPYSSMHTSQPTTFCHILPCTLLVDVDGWLNGDGWQNW
jgi:hypothetical protein